jgi:tRNA(Ile)-lysidine synthetase-like protein
MHNIEHSISSKVRALLRENAAGKRLLLAVSGGIDSVAMLDIVCRVVPEIHSQCVVGHVDHGLRAESAVDADFVSNLARQYGLAAQSREVDVATLARAKKLSQEAAARTLRYRALEEMAAEAKCDLILTAHTMDDSAETFLLRLLQSPDWWEWTSIPMKRGNILRPLISVRRRELHDYAHQHSLSWREDLSNQDLRFPRNYLRLKLLPDLAAQGGDMDISALAKAGGQVREVVDELVKEADEYVKESRVQQGRIVLAIPEIFSYFDMICWAPVERAVALVADNPSLRWPAWRRRQVMQLVRAQTPSSRLRVDSNTWLLRHGQKLAVTTRLPEPISHQLSNTGLHRFEGLGEMNIAIRPNDGSLVNENRICIRGILPRNGFHLRTWRPGDRLNIARRGSRKVADLLSEAHVDPISRMSALVMCDTEGPFWLVGYRVDQRVQPESDEEFVVELEWKPTTA